MKCPNCGKWNQASLPHCIYCGTELSPDESLSWQKELGDQSKVKAYIRVDENGEIDSTVDYRDALANEMADLKRRKSEGEMQRKELSDRLTSKRAVGSNRNVRTVNNQGIFFSNLATESNEGSKNTPELTQESTENDYSASGSRFHITYSENSSQSDNVIETDEQEVLDGYNDVSLYTASYSKRYAPNQGPYFSQGKPINTRHRFWHSFKKALVVLLILFVIVALIYLAYTLISNRKTNDESQASISMTLDQDGLTAHTIMIPGTDGQRITIRELRTSAIVTGGYATFTISDHLWYDDYENNLQDSMRVVLTPYLVSDNGNQAALPQIEYVIDIPISPIELDTPSTPYQVVATTLANVVFYVQPGSSVTVNQQDYSDLVDTTTGKVSFNATVQPIGENVFVIRVRSQYCRENSLTITLYREKQEIPLDLASDTSSTSSSGTASMTIKGTTMPGAVIKVLSPYVDLDITETASNGNFSFIAKFDKIGKNQIIITADYPGKQTTRVEHIVDYVPNIDVYSRKAWDIVTQYTDLINNIDLRKNNSQIYVCKGEITTIDTTKPQRCFMNVGTEEEPLMIYIENASKTTWELGNRYRLYADAFGMYDSKPWLIARYTYEIK